MQAKIEELGVSVHISKSTVKIVSEEGKVSKMLFSDGSELATDMIVFSAGIRPRDELANACGLEVGERGGIVIDEYCQTSDQDIYAIGECALYEKRIYAIRWPPLPLTIYALPEPASSWERICPPNSSSWVWM
jgi:nitrite reductase (NADH) large subunit